MPRHLFGLLFGLLIPNPFLWRRPSPARAGKITGCLGCSTMLGILVWALVIGLTRVNAAAPTNDVCSQAEIIPSNPTFPYLTAARDISEATVAGDPPAASCGFGTESQSIWYSFTPAHSGTYTLSSCADAPTATTVPFTLLTIYTSSGAGCAGVLTELMSSPSSMGCDNGSCGPVFGQAAVTAQLASGTTYYVVLWQNGDGPTAPGHSTVQLRVSTALPPANDTAAGATPVFLDLPVLGTTLLANDDYELPDASDCFSGTGQSSSLAAGRDVVYSFTAPAAANYSIKVDHYDNGGAYDLVIYAANSLPTDPPPATVTDCLAAANRSSASEAEEIMCLPLAAAQQIFIVVDEDMLSPEGSSFLLLVTRCTPETEPNDTWPTANPFSFGVEGSLNPAGDTDFFTLGGFPVGARVFAMMDGSASSYTDSQLRVVEAASNSVNTLEYDYGNNDDLFGELSSNVAGTPLTGRPAFLRVSGLAGLAVEPYRLYAVVQPPLAFATPETEPNNTPALATKATNNYFYGSLAGPAPSTDVDVYSFSVKAVDGVSDLIFLSLDADPLRDNTPINARVELLDSSGKVLLAVDDDASTSSTNTTTGTDLANSPYSPGEALLFPTLADGTYYVRVSASPGATSLDGAGDYLLSISRNGFIGSCGCNNPPAFGAVNVPSPAFRYAPVTITGAFVDYDLGQSHQVVVDWGDGSSNSTTNVPAGIFSFSASHSYISPISPRTVNLVLHDDHGGVTTTNVSVIVQSEPDQARLISITFLPVGSTLLQLHGTPSTIYRVETSPDLSAWTGLGAATADANGFFQIEDPNFPLLPQRFYRAVWP